MVRASFLVGKAAVFAAVCCQGQTSEKVSDCSLSIGETPAPGAASFPLCVEGVDPQVALMRNEAPVLQVQQDELKLALRKMLSDNAELKQQLREKEKTVQLLTQNLAIWKSEAELFQQKWEEAHLAAKASGAKLMTEGEQRLQKQLAGTIRQLYGVQLERDRLRDQMERLIEMTNLVLDKAAELDPQLRRLAEVQRDTALETGQMVGAQARRATPDTGSAAAAGEGYAGKVVDVNKALRLVVLNLGRVNGVAVGMPFLIMRGDAVVGQVKVVDVREQISGALIEKTEPSPPIAVGDRVKLSMEK